MKTAMVVGNPKANSRTADAAGRLVHALSGAKPTGVVELAEHGASLLTWGNVETRRLRDEVASCELIVVASPTFKATYSGLLKLLLDQFAGGEGLRGVVAVPLMLGASPAPGLYLIDSDDGRGQKIAEYADRWRTPLLAVVAAVAGR